MADLLPCPTGFVEFSNGNRHGKDVDFKLIRDSQGRITGKKIKRVCGPCNSIWMSGLETEVAPALTGLIQAKPDILTKAVRRSLANWIVMKLMVVDAMRDEEQAFLEVERSAFFKNRAIPDHLSVWLLRCGEEPWTNAYKAHAQGVLIYVGGKPEDVEPISPGSPNLKLFIWGLGELVVAACYHRDVGIEFDMQDTHSIRLLPDPGIGRVWPTQKITAYDVEELTKTLKALPAKLGARYFELPRSVTS